MNANRELANLMKKRKITYLGLGIKFKSHANRNGLRNEENEFSAQLFRGRLRVPLEVVDFYGYWLVSPHPCDLRSLHSLYRRFIHFTTSSIPSPRLCLQLPSYL